MWAAPGRDKDTLNTFFDLLGEDRCAQITHVCADSAEWIGDVVDERCPDAVRGADPFHVLAWATEALDEVRREVWDAARGGKGRATPASKALKNARWALWKDPDDLSEAQQAKLDWIRTHPPDAAPGVGAQGRPGCFGCLGKAFRGWRSPPCIVDSIRSGTRFRLPAARR